MQIKFNPAKIILYFGIAATLSTSVYFNTGFFEWIGFDIIFVWLFPIVTVGMMDSTFQAGLNFFIHKRKILSIFLFFIWLIFFSASMIFTIFGMWYKMDKAREGRKQGAVKLILDDPTINIINDQIKTAELNFNSYREKYKNEGNAWVAYKEIKPELEKATNELQSLYKEKKGIISKQALKIESAEIGITEEGILSPSIKYAIAIILDFITDMGGCILTMFLWIFEKKKNTVLIKPPEIKTDISTFIKQKSYNEYLVEYANIVYKEYDDGFNGSTKLLGFTHPDVISARFPNWFLTKMKSAKDKNLVKIKGKGTFALVTKDKFIEEMKDDN